MLAEAPPGYAANDNHLIRFDRLKGGINPAGVMAYEFLIEPGDTRRGIKKAFSVRILADSEQDFPDGLFYARPIHL